ncbi:acyltransferase [Sphingobacterium sp. lm-10]|uniref:acyltransferase family protein n=1 Tax=Sphingobacterium sp. lm-10 TaxID=2944904 RepID=UPI002021E1B6|nr:acyltransferase [Sphingobacterium sp. lm-10]MCL7988414.1 acyltransferase [Sphingobacterium sp. lm-10]
MKKIITMDQRQSEIIEFLRFPLIVLVVYVHMLPFEQQPILFELNIRNMYVLISELISHHIGRIAVPCFFLFSGYFFFLKITTWSNRLYFDNLKKRYQTLLIPYILWNSILIIAILAKNTLFVALDLPTDESYAQFSHVSLYDLFWGMPVNFPLWYLRDLIAMTIISPLFFYFFKHLKIYGLLILAVFYLSVFESGLPGLSSTAIFFFGAGAYLGLHKQNMLQLSMRYGKRSFYIAIVCLMIATYYTAMPQNEYWIRFYALFAAASILYVGNRLISFKRLRELVLPLAQTAFFIYAIHLIYILNWLKGGLRKSLNFLPDFFLIVGYFLVPIICVLVISVIYSMMKRYLPKTLSVLTGNRAK